MGLIKGWLVAALAAAVFAIAPMYYGLFATLDGPANREKWFTPERQKDFDAWAERLLADGKPLELSRTDMVGPIEAFAISNDISHVAVSPSEKRVKWLIFGRNRVGVHYELGDGNWSVVGVKDARASGGHPCAREGGPHPVHQRTAEEADGRRRVS